MVRRRSTAGGGLLPYPASPISPHISESVATSPTTASKTHYPTQPARDEKPWHEAHLSLDREIANPWAEQNGNPLLEKSLPPIPQAGSQRSSSEELQTSSDIPKSPRPVPNEKATPRSSSESQRLKETWEENNGLEEKDFWDEEEDDDNDEPVDAEDSFGNDNQNRERSHEVTVQPEGAMSGTPPSGEPLPAIAGVSKRKPVGPSDRQNLATGPKPDQLSNSHGFASNNPFRRQAPVNGMSQHGGAEEGDINGLPGFQDTLGSPTGKGKEVVRDLAAYDTTVPMAANLSLEDRPFSEYSSSYRPSNLDLNYQYRSQDTQAIRPPQSPSLPAHPSSPPPPIPVQSIHLEEQPPLIPVTPDQSPEQNPWASETHFETPVSPVSGDGGHGGHIGVLAPQTGQEQEFGVVSLGKIPVQIHRSEKLASPSILRRQRDADIGPPLPARPRPQDQPEESEETYLPLDFPPPKPPRPEVQRPPINEAALAKLNKQRNETYQIKHFNWFDYNSGALRRSSMLTQNKNGPCPLLALVNALILGTKDDSDSALGNALRAREQVSLGLIIESLIDELTSEGPRGGGLEELPDVDELNRFLVMLHTGMNANPRLAARERQAPNLMDARNSVLHLPTSINNDRKPGTFEETQDVLLYSAFSIPLIHGWLPPKSHPARAAFTRAAPTYEDAQTIQFGEEELEDKLSRLGLTPVEQQLLQDIVSVKSFLKTYPTQLTPHGLDVVSESLFPGAFAILFRNDHFNTIYKHPESGQLFTLVTDAGYSDRDEVIWESLVDVSGQQSEFFSGDFRPVGNVEEVAGASEAGPEASRPTSLPPTQRRSSAQDVDPSSMASPISPLEQQELHDADFAMALQLQEEEEARANDARRRSGHNRQSNASNIPIRLRSQDLPSRRAINATRA